MPPPECMLHGEQLARLIASLDAVAGKMESLLISSGKTEVEIAHLQHSIDAARDDICDLRTSITAVQTVQATQASQILEIQRRLGIHSDRFAGSDTALEKKHHRRQMEDDESGTRRATPRGLGWISVQGIIKVLVAIGVIAAAYFGSKGNNQ